MASLNEAMHYDRKHYRGHLFSFSDRAFDNWQVFSVSPRRIRRIHSPILSNCKCWLDVLQLASHPQLPIIIRAYAPL